jgi:hypothetical protein
MELILSVQEGWMMGKRGEKIQRIHDMEEAGLDAKPVAKPVAKPL